MKTTFATKAVAVMAIAGVIGLASPGVDAGAQTKASKQVTQKVVKKKAVAKKAPKKVTQPTVKTVTKLAVFSAMNGKDAVSYIEKIGIVKNTGTVNGVTSFAYTSFADKDFLKATVTEKGLSTITVNSDTWKSFTNTELSPDNIEAYEASLNELNSFNIALTQVLKTVYGERAQGKEREAITAMYNVSGNGKTTTVSAGQKILEIKKVQNLVVLTVKN